MNSLSLLDDSRKLILVSLLGGIAILALGFIVVTQSWFNQAVTNQQEFLRTHSQRVLEDLEIDKLLNRQTAITRDTRKTKAKLDQLIKQNGQINQIFLFQQQPGGNPEFICNSYRDPKRYIDSRYFKKGTNSRLKYMFEDKFQVATTITPIPHDPEKAPPTYLGVVFTADTYYADLAKIDSYKTIAYILIALFVSFVLLTWGSPKFFQWIHSSALPYEAKLLNPMIADYSWNTAVVSKLSSLVGRPRPVLSGKLEEVELLDVIQMFHLSAKTGRLEIRGESGIPGVVYLKEGEVVHSAYKDLWGEPAVRALVLKKKGTFEFFLGERTQTRSINVKTTHLLLRVTKDIDEQTPISLISSVHKRGI